VKVIDVYQQYFGAACVFHDVPRRAVSAMLTAESNEGEISYTLTLSFFPHEDETDFSVSYDAVVSEELYRARGRRSKKREKTLLEEFRPRADALAAAIGGTIDWDSPLREARWG